MNPKHYEEAKLNADKYSAEENVNWHFSNGYLTALDRPSVRNLLDTLRLIAGPVEFYDANGERSKQVAAQEALKEWEGNK